MHHDLPHDDIAAQLRYSLAAHEPGDPPLLLALHRRDGAVTAEPLPELTGLYRLFDRLGSSGGDGLSRVARIARASTSSALGVSNPKSLIAVAFRFEAWELKASAYASPEQFAEELERYRSLSEHPDATTLYTCWAYCVDGVLHRADWAAGEPAPNWEQFAPGCEDRPEGEVVDALRELLHALTGTRLFRTDRSRP